eukprot:Lithocolla_globosa_v1_NODE_2695_length_1901_cov_748.919285.p2 type:complete len:112 gc:universal NODE_2695_length_1901_cov_748.919285:750-415(-)
MRSTTFHVFGINVDNIATNGTGRVQHQSLIFGDFDTVLGLLVDGTFINSLRNGIVNQLTEKDTIFDVVEQVIRSLERQDLLEFGVLFQDVVNPVKESDGLVIGIGVSSSGS